MNDKTSIDDEAVLQATGRSWREWCGVMESAGMAELSHREIIAALRDDHGVPSWWQQTIADGFERFIGRRQKAEEDDGFQSSVTRMLDLPAVRAYEMWADDRPRGRWLRKRDFEVTAFDSPRSVSGRWTRDDSWIDVSIEEVADDRCRMTVRHRRLPDVETAEEMRKFWKMAIERLAGKAT